MVGPNAKTILIVGAAVFFAACGDPRATASRQDAQTDEAFLMSSLWDDGQAEVAFYQLRRSVNQYGEAEEQEFLVGSYLVKHDFDPKAEAKADEDARNRIPSFKYAIFYEFESGSYEYKRSYVTNARQSDLHPLKTSFASFDWCSNQYREMSFSQGGSVDYLMRSDDYGNQRSTFDYEPRSYPAAQIPLLVRALDFGVSDTASFGVLLESGETVAASAHLAGSDSVATPTGPTEAERIVVIYESPIPSPLAEEADPSEIYWRAMDPSRTLLRMEGSTGRYEMDLVEALRSPYWDENIYRQLERVQERP